MRTFTSILLITLFFMIRPLQGQTFKIDTIQFKGATSEMVNIVILGDGYTAAQMSTFVSNSTSFTIVFFLMKRP